MGQPITVVEKPSSRAGVVRYEINRSLTGMGHERYRAGDEIHGETPADELARRLLGLGGIAAVHLNANVVTVELSGHGTDELSDHGTAGIAETIADLHLYYVEGVEVPTEEDFAAEAE